MQVSANHQNKVSKILAFAHKPSFFNEFAAKIQYGVETLIEETSIPIHWVANGLFDWEMNMTPYFYFYKDGIERTYGYVPLDYTLEHFANGRRAMFVKNVWAEPISLSVLRNFLRNDIITRRRLMVRRGPVLISLLMLPPVMETRFIPTE